MPPCAEMALARVAELMRRHGFEQLLAVPAVPAHGVESAHYDLRVQVTPTDEEWCLRSFGTTFCILPASMERDGINRCYSVGWGMVDRRATPRLLLVEAHLDSRHEAQLLGQAIESELQTFSSRVGWDMRHSGRHWALYLAADMLPEQSLDTEAS